MGWMRWTNGKGARARGEDFDLGDFEPL
jgi:hypothetical protein